MLYGKIIDALDKSPLAGTTVEVLTNGGVSRGIYTTANAQGYFDLNSPAIASTDIIAFTNAEYKTVQAKAQDIYDATFYGPEGAIIEMQPDTRTNDNVTVYSTPHKSNTSLLLLGGLGLLLLAAKDKNKSVSGTKIEPNTVLMIGGGLIGLTVVNKILISLGISTGPGGKAAEQAATDPNSPWQPAYYKNLPAGTRYYTLTDSAKDQFPEIIYNAFTLFKDNFDKIMGVFSQLQTKTQVSVLSEAFLNKYNRQLISFLKDGGGLLPWDGLSDSQFLTLTNYVNNLPATWP